MDIRKLTRDAQFIHSCLHETKDAKLIALEPVKIYIPARFEERGLAEVGAENRIIGIYAMVAGDKYAVSLVNAMLEIKPSSTLLIKIDEIDYYEFSFDKGQVICPNLNLVKKDTLVYKIYDEILAKGKAPWFMDYLDLGNIFNTAKEYAGTNVGSNNVVTELIISLLSRDNQDKTKYYRTTVQSLEEIKSRPPFVIPLTSVEYAATNTTNKLAGSYYHTGVVSALNNESTRTEKIEEILRK